MHLGIKTLAPSKRVACARTIYHSIASARSLPFNFDDLKRNLSLWTCLHGIPHLTFLSLEEKLVE